MSASIKEALAALEIIGSGYDKPSRLYYRTIRAALEAAAQEAEAWEAIEAFCLENRLWCHVSWRKHRLDEVVGIGSARCTVSISDKDNDARFVSTAALRLEALTKAAAWCRAELVK